MQSDELNKLVARLKTREDAKVTTTTLGEFLGAKSEQLAAKLGGGMLSRPVLVAETTNSIQVLDLNKGWVIVLKNMDEAVSKIVSTFSGAEDKISPQLDYFSKENIITETVYDELMKMDSSPETFAQHIRDINFAIQKSASREMKVRLIKKTIELLETRKNTADVSAIERGMASRAQERLKKLIDHTSSRAIAAGQIPAVFEIAVWHWVKGD